MKAKKTALKLFKLMDDPFTCSSEIIKILKNKNKKQFLELDYNFAKIKENVGGSGLVIFLRFELTHNEYHTLKEKIKF